MKKLLLACCLTIPAWVFAQSYWQQRADYVLEVSLNDVDHTLDGFARLHYTNNSPDTLHFLWFHLWPNAYKNDRTAFSEQQLENRSTDFYFSDKDEKGYINRVDFRINGSSLKTEDHPHYIDVVKVLLPQSLAPETSVEFVISFHVKLPHLFSRSGHINQSYQITQWYPKPAVYDRKGWHPMPYLDQGEFYSEFGTYDVRITVPDDYIVAATGQLQNEDEKQWLKNLGSGEGVKVRSLNGEVVSATTGSVPGSSGPKPVKTLRYIQSDVHDFAWFADKHFFVQFDTLNLSSGRLIELWSFAQRRGGLWQKAISLMKDAVRFRSMTLSDYPFNVLSVVESPDSTATAGGMEYPTITVLSGQVTEKEMDLILEHEIGHNWFYGALASNERLYPWMDEGMNSYYDNRYMKLKYGAGAINSKWNSKLPEDPEMLLLDWLVAIKKDQPINTSGENFTPLNYHLISYVKSAAWMLELERIVGREVFDRCMRAYYDQWKFRHPYPEDFREVMEKESGRDLANHFELLSRTGGLKPRLQPKVRPTFLFSLRDADSIHYIGILPAFNYNMYDGLMVGGAIHNYNIPPSRFQFILLPLFATNSRKLTGAARLSYSVWSQGRRQVSAALSGSRFSTISGTDSSGEKIFGGYFRIVPSLKIRFNNSYARSSVENFVEWKTFLITESDFQYRMSSDSIFYPTESPSRFRYINQLTFQHANDRVLYPYLAQMQMQQAKNFYRINTTFNYFFNYSKGGGAGLRLFAAKFGYLGKQSANAEFETYLYQPKLTAVRGYEDYTYSNLFFGRSENTGFASQQIMMRDGDLKLRTDLFQGLQGRSDNWVASINLTTTLPSKMFPVKLPVRLFFDAGTYAQAWESESETARFLYVAGLQLSLFKEILNVYAPIFYSSEFRNSIKTVPEENRFLRKISFSIDIHRIRMKRILENELSFQP